MSPHSIIQGNLSYQFQFWRGDPPQLPHQQAATRARPGADDVALQKLGFWGRQFQCQLTAHFSGFLTAMGSHRLYYNLPGSSAVTVQYNHVNFFSMYGVKYFVNSVQVEAVNANLLLMGPGYVFPGGTEVITRWVMTPVNPTTS